jgi:peptidoglycan L-alanyl-D-glutamate endopeptidase CwlK
MPYEFGNRSKQNLETCHPDLQLVANEVIKITRIDFGISEGHRSIQKQQVLYQQGKTTIDGITRKGRHNYLPSEALDFFVYHPDLDYRTKMVYDKVHMAYIAGMFMAIADRLYKEGRITHRLRWGGNWDMDGVIQFDQSFQDFPHIEII